MNAQKEDYDVTVAEGFWPLAPGVGIYAKVTYKGKAPDPTALWKRMGAAALTPLSALAAFALAACDDSPNNSDSGFDSSPDGDGDVDTDVDSDSGVQNVLTPVRVDNVRYSDGENITSQDVRRDEAGNDYINITRTSPDVDPASGVNPDEVVVSSEVERCIDDVCIEVGSVVAEPGDTADNRMEVTSTPDSTNIIINYTFTALDRNTLEPLENGIQQYVANITFNAGLDRVRVTGCRAGSANNGSALSITTAAQDPSDESGRSLIGNYEIIDSTLEDATIGIQGSIGIIGRQVTESDIGYHRVTFTASNGSQTSDPFTCDFYIDQYRSIVKLDVSGCADDRYNGEHEFLLPQNQVLELAMFQYAPKDGDGEVVRCWDGFREDALPGPGESYIGDMETAVECMIRFFMSLTPEEQAIQENYNDSTPAEVISSCEESIYHGMIEFHNLEH